MPFEDRLDLSPYCTPECVASGTTEYRLYAVLVHEGLSVHGGYAHGPYMHARPHTRRVRVVQCVGWVAGYVAVGLGA